MVATPGQDGLEVRVSTSGADEATNNLNSVGEAAKSMGAKVGAAGAALAAVSAGGLAKAVSAAADFESQMVELEKVTDPSTAREMGDAIQEMSGKMPLAQSELAGIAEQAGRLGIEGTENIKNFTRVTGEMATATDLSAEQAADSFARMSTLMQEPISKVRKIGDATNALSNSMATSSAEITDAATRSAGALTNMGASSQEVLALNATMNTVSSSARIAGTQLRRVAQEMMSPKKVSDLSSALGMTASEFKNMRSNDPTKLIKLMAKRMGEGGDAAEALRGTLSTTSRQALASLSQNLDGLNAGLKTSQKQFQKGGSLAEEFESAMGTFKNTVQITKNTLRNLGITTGQAVLPYFTSFFETVNSGLDALQSFNKETDGVAGSVGLLTGLIGGLTAAVGGALRHFGMVANLTRGMGVAFAGVGAPLTALIGLIAAYRSDAAGVATQTERIVAALRTELVPILAELANAWASMGGRVKSVAASLSDTIAYRLVGAIERAGSQVRGQLAKITIWWQQHGAAVTSTINQFSTHIQEAFIQLMAGVSTAVAGEGEGEGSFVYFFKEALSELLAAARSLGVTLPEPIRSALSKVSTTVSTKLNQIPAVVARVRGAILDEWRRFGGEIQRNTDRFVEGIQASVRFGLTALTALVRGNGAKFSTAWSDLTAEARTLWRTGLSALKGTTRVVLRSLKVLIGKQVSRFVDPWRTSLIQIRGAVKAGLAAVKALLRGDASRMHQLFGIMMQQARVAVQNGLLRVKQLFGSRLAQARAIARRALAALRKRWAMVFGILPNTVQRALTRAQRLVSQKLSLVSGIVDRHGSGVLASIRSGYQRAVRGALTRLAQLSGGIRNTLARARRLWTQHGGKVKRTVQNTYQRARTLATEAVRSLKNRGQQLLNRLSVAWTSLKTAILGAIRPIVPKIVRLGQQFGFLDQQGNLTKQGLVALGSTILSLTGPIGMVIGSAAKLASAWSNNLLSLRTKTLNAWNRIRGLFRSAKADLTQIVNGLGHSVDRYMQVSGNAWIQTIRHTMNTLRGVFQGVLNAVMPIVRNALDNLSSFWKAHGEEIQLILGALVVAVSEIFRRLHTTIREIVEPALAAIGFIWEHFGDEIVATVDFMQELVLATIGAMLDALAGTIKVAMAAIEGDWGRAWDLIVGGVRDAFQKMNRFLKKWSSGFIQAIGNLVDGIISWFQDLARELVGSSIIPEMLDAITSKIDTFVSDVLRFFGNLVSKAVGEANDLKRKVVNQIIKLSNLAASKAETLVSRVMGFISSLPGKAQSAGESLKTKFVNKVIKLKNRVVDNVSNLAQTAMDWLTGEKGPLSNVKSAGKSLIEGFIGGIEDKAGAVGDAVDNAVQKARDKLPFSPAEEGPLSDLDETGPAFIGEIAGGIVANTSELASAAKKAAAAARPPMPTGGMSIPSEVSHAVAAAGSAQRGRTIRKGDTIIRRIQVKVTRSATKEDGENVADGIVDEFYARGMDL